MKNTIDLHLHTTESDGTSTPSQLVDEAIAAGLKYIAITDHDSTDGIDEAMEYAKDKDITVFPGVEFTAMIDIDNKIENYSVPDFWHMSDEELGQRFSIFGETNQIEIHLLGYNFDYKNKDLLENLGYLDYFRSHRMEEMLECIQKDYPFVSFDEFNDSFPGATLTRSNLATYLVNKGIAKDVSDAFKNYIGDKCKYYVHKIKITAEGAHILTDLAGGFNVLAHPVLVKDANKNHLTDEQYDVLFHNLAQYGVKGVEAIYSKNKPGDTERFTAMAEKYGFFITGGSDYHGTAKPDVFIGSGCNNNLFVPESVLKNFM